jgi:hypothetical protein
LAFFALIKPSSKDVNSSSNLLEKLMCVLCYLALVVGLNKGIITYETTNGIFATRKHLEITHQEMWAEWSE